MTLDRLLPLLDAEPALNAVLGRRDAVFAVPEPARALALASLVVRSGRRPFLVAVPTSGEAERLTHDLGAFLGAGEVELFGAWETLPFERVSPAVATMGRRSRVLWRLQESSRAPAVVVAPIRALVQRLGPATADPIIVRVGEATDRTALVDRLVHSGYRREVQVEHRGEFAVRGSIVDVYPSTADGPVRIDLWGDEVDRLSEFAVTDQRSTDAVPSVEIFPCRELLLTDEVRDRAAALVGTQPWGREQWERLAEGQTFDGMESWLPWLVTDDVTAPALLTDLFDDAAQIVLIDPARLRSRAADIAAEEADLASALARTWGADDRRLPTLHLGFERMLARTSAPMWTALDVPDSPSTPVVGATGWDPVVGDGSTLVAQLSSMLAAGSTVVVAADGAGSATRLGASLAERGLHLDVVSIDSTSLAAPGGRIVVAPLERGARVAGCGLALLAESDITGR
ncbi:MAG: transcription-repair coupling factor, partial [Acidobacteria bacterium]|nr:transcription-repair coupling factor [Acidobacteriota bacterium]